jgi:hypothetical protein
VSITAFYRERPGFNDAGLTIDSARVLSDGATVFGTIMGTEAGHHYRIHLEDEQTLTLDGVYTGDETTGAVPTIDVYDEDGDLVADHLLHITAYGETEETVSFTNETGLAQDFVVHLYNDIGLSIVYDLTEYALNFSLD